MRCFVASDDTGVAGQVRDLLVELGQACPTSHVNTLDRVWGDLDKGTIGLPGTHSKEAASIRGPQSAAEIEIVVLVLSPDPERALEVMRSNRRRTAARILLVGPTTDTKLVLRALREGANEFLDQSDLKSELTAALNRLSVDASSGRVIALLSASGGCGCSTLAVNLAVCLAKSYQSCAVLDLQFEFGDLATMLDVKPTYSIADLCRNVRRLDPSLLEGCMIKHPSGVELLAAPQKIADRMKVTEDCVNEVVSLVTRRYPFAVVDLGNLIRTERTRILLQVDLILLVLRMDFACLRNTRFTLEYLNEIGIPRDRVEVIGNRCGLPNEITAAAAEEALGVEISQCIPDDAKNINRAINNGIPVLLQSPTAKVSRAIADLAARISMTPAHTA